MGYGKLSATQKIQTTVFQSSKKHSSLSIINCTKKYYSKGIMNGDVFVHTCDSRHIHRLRITAEPS